MQYTIVTGDSSWDLKQQVNQHLKLGWRPEGSVSVTKMDVFGLDIRYTQGMVKE